MPAIGMFNALWFRPDGGAERYYRDYATAVLPLLGEAGAEVVIPFLEVDVALEGEFSPDVVGVVRYPSAEAFDAMVAGTDYPAAAAHAHGALDRRVLTQCSIEGDEGPVSLQPGVLVANLLWLREGGRQRYEDYLAAARPHVEQVGGRLLVPRFLPQRTVEDDFRPDLIFFGNYPSKQAVFNLVSSPAYQQEAAPIRADAVARSMTTILRVPRVRQSMVT